MSPEEFAHEFGPEFTHQQAPTIDNTPYGGPVQAHKPGLTKRGKAALAIGATVIAGSSLIVYQAYSASAAEAEQKAQEIALKSQALELEKLKELNRANEADRKTQSSQERARQASVDTCVKSHAGQVGKGFGSPSYRDVVDDCRAQYSGGSSGTDMQAAASTEDAGDGSGGGVNQAALIGGGVLVVFLVAAAKKGTRSNAA